MNTIQHRRKATGNFEQYKQFSADTAHKKVPHTRQKVVCRSLDRKTGSRMKGRKLKSKVVRTIGRREKDARTKNTAPTRDKKGMNPDLLSATVYFFPAWKRIEESIHY
jgi:hypothetical protein